MHSLVGIVLPKGTGIPESYTVFEITALPFSCLVSDSYALYDPDTNGLLYVLHSPCNVG